MIPGYIKRTVDRCIDANILVYDHNDDKGRYTHKLQSTAVNFIHSSQRLARLREIIIGPVYTEVNMLFSDIFAEDYFLPQGVNLSINPDLLQYYLDKGACLQGADKNLVLFRFSNNKNVVGSF